MKDFKFLFSLLSVFLFLFSCQNGLDEQIPISEVSDGTIVERHDGDTTGDEGDCNCQYFIVDYQGPASGVGFNLQQNDEDNDCNPSCALFEASFSTDECEDNSGNNCIEDLPTPDPYGVYNFNCASNSGSTLGISFRPQELSLPDCLPGGELEEVSITFYIICSQTVQGGSCPGTSYISDPITLTGYDDIKVKLIDAECGCIPEVQ